MRGFRNVLIINGANMSIHQTDTDVPSHPV